MDGSNWRPVVGVAACLVALTTSCGHSAAGDPPSPSPEGRTTDARMPNATFVAELATEGLLVAVVSQGADLLAFVLEDASPGMWLRGRVRGWPATLSGRGGDDVPRTLTLLGAPDQGRLRMEWRHKRDAISLDAWEAPSPALFRLEMERAGVRLRGGFVRVAPAAGPATLGGALEVEGGRAKAATVDANGVVECPTCDFVPLGTPLGAEAVAPQGITGARRDTERRFAFLTLGDSYASGEGAPAVDGHYDASGASTDGVLVDWGDGLPLGVPANAFTNDERARRARIARACHRSTAAASYLVARELQAAYPNVAIVHDLLACSGAETPDLVARADTGYENCEERSGSDRADCETVTAALPAGEAVAPQLRQADDFMSRFGVVPDAITVSAGGNDVGFATIVTDCISPLSISGCHATASKANKALETGLASLPERYGALATAVRDRAFPASRTFVALYPNALMKGTTACAGGDFSDAGDTLLSNIDAAEAMFANEALGALNGAVRASAMNAGFHVLDAHVQSAVGHSLCNAAYPWFATWPAALRSQGRDVVSPLDFLADFNPYKLSSGMVHPNREGHRHIYAPVIRSALEPLLVERFTPRTPPSALRVARAEASGSITIAWDDASSNETSYRVRVTVLEGAVEASPSEQRVSANTLEVTLAAKTRAAVRVQVAACVDGGAGHEWCSEEAALSAANRAPVAPLEPAAVAVDTGAAPIVVSLPTPNDVAHQFYVVEVATGSERRTVASEGPVQRLPASDTGASLRVASCNDLGCSRFSGSTKIP